MRRVTNRPHLPRRQHTVKFSRWGAFPSTSMPRPSSSIVTWRKVAAPVRPSASAAAPGGRARATQPAAGGPAAVGGPAASLLGGARRRGGVGGGGGRPPCAVPDESSVFPSVPRATGLLLPAGVGGGPPVVIPPVRA